MPLYRLKQDRYVLFWSIYGFDPNDPPDFFHIILMWPKSDNQSNVKNVQYFSCQERALVCNAKYQHLKTSPYSSVCFGYCTFHPILLAVMFSSSTYDMIKYILIIGNIKTGYNNSIHVSNECVIQYNKTKQSYGNIINQASVTCDISPF